jgi:glycosyltransferase involved in cell wall biosynthesis
VKKISVVIPTYNHLEDFLKPCCQSIIDYTDLTDIEIIVVANGCKDGTREYVNSLGPNFKLIWFDKGLGYTVATNEGVKVAEGEVIILMNNDVVLLPQRKHEWIDFLMNPLKDKIGITCNLKIWDQSVERMFAVGFLMAFPRFLWDKIGGFDPSWSPGGGEDIEFCLQVEQLGYKVIQVPDEYNEIRDGLNVNRFMSYHKGEGTVMDAEHREMWEKHIADVRKRLEKKYKLPEGWFYGGDIAEYRRLVEDLPVGSTMCELGCYKGRSLCSVADIIKRKKLKVFVVDIFTGTDNEVKEDNYRHIFEGNIERFRISDQVTVYEGSTDHTHILFPDTYFDLLFIDADHSEQAVRKDLKNWLPKMKPGSTISGHDYGNHPGVSKVVNETWDNVRVNDEHFGIDSGITQGSVWSKRL